MSTLRPIPYSLITVMGLMILCFSHLLPSLSAQETAHSVSVAVPEALVTIFDNMILPPFREENPDVSVTIIPIPQALYQDLMRPSSQEELEKYLDATETLVSLADVIFTLPPTLSPEATRAGYYLDLNPLVAGDAALPIDDFVPAAWQSYQWDGGYWALPARVTSLVIAYDPVVFDAKGLTYPTERWTMADFANAARGLSEDGRPGLQVNSIDLPLFFRTFLTQGYIDESLPANITLDTPELVALLEQWHTLEAEGAATQGYVEDAPLQLTRISALQDRKLSGVLLPGGQSGMDVFGIALSRGANDVEAAYRVATYFTAAPEMQVVGPDAVSARYSTQQKSEVTLSLTVEATQLRDEALTNAIPFSELVFGSEINQALSAMAAGDEASIALQNAQLEAEARLGSAKDRQEEVVIVVPIQTPVPVASADEVVIKFGLFTGYTDLPNRGDWERVIEEFVAADGTIERIDLNFVPSTQGYWDAIPENDCVYGYTIGDYTDEQLVALEPLIATDPTFEADDVIGMQDMQRNGQIFSLPVTIFPYVLRYDRAAFEAAGLPEPDGTWTVNEFVDTLNQLEAGRKEQRLQLLVNYTTPWEMLIAAYGAPLIDYSSSQPTLNLSNPDVLSAVRQVLDLGKSGLVNYAKMSTFFGEGQPGNGDMPLVADYYTLDGVGKNSDRYGIVTFPVSDEAVPVSYYTTSGFIFAHAPQPEACYRWLRELSRHPELYQGMPAYRSVIDSPSTEAVYGEKQVQTFKFFADLIADPNSVFIRYGGLETGERMFLARAFDRYVLEDADLEAELLQAAELIELYRVCYTESQDTLECLLETDSSIRDQIDERILGDR